MDLYFTVLTLFNLYLFVTFFIKYRPFIQLGAKFAFYYLYERFRVLSDSFSPSKNNGTEEGEEKRFFIRKHNNYISFSYLDPDDNKRRKLFIPLEVSNTLEMNECEVYIFYKDGETEKLKQDPEIPILVTADDIDADYIEVKNKFNGETRKYRGNDKVVCFTSD
jgi:hypothetical protein